MFRLRLQFVVGAGSASRGSPTATGDPTSGRRTAIVGLQRCKDANERTQTSITLVESGGVTTGCGQSDGRWVDRTTEQRLTVHKVHTRHNTHTDNLSVRELNSHCSRQVTPGRCNGRRIAAAAAEQWTLGSNVRGDCIISIVVSAHKGGGGGDDHSNATATTGRFVAH